MSLTILSSPLEQFPLDLSFSVKSRFSGDDITSGSQMLIELEGKWEKLTDSLHSLLKTGKEYQFRFTHEGYEDSFYTVETAFYQTFVTLDVLLSPESAFLKIPPFENGILKIDNKEEYFSLKSLKFEELNKNTDAERILELLPGNYSLTFDGEKKSLEKLILLEKGKEYRFLFD